MIRSIMEPEKVTAEKTHTHAHAHAHTHRALSMAGNSEVAPTVSLCPAYYLT